MSGSRLLEELSGWTTWHGTTLPHTPEAPECAAQAQGTGTGTPVATGTVTAAPVPKPEAQGTVVAPEPALVLKRNHNRRPESKYRGGKELTIEEQQRVTTLAANGNSPYRIAQTIGKGINMVKRHLDTPEVIAEVSEERQELVETYREKARDCLIAIDSEKIAKASALQLATSSGILLDKSLLLSGKPTQNVAVIVEVLDMLVAQRDEQEEREWQESRARLEQQKQLAGNKP